MSDKHSRLFPLITLIASVLLHVVSADTLSTITSNRNVGTAISNSAYALSPDSLKDTVKKADRLARIDSLPPGYDPLIAPIRGDSAESPDLVTRQERFETDHLGFAGALSRHPWFTNAVAGLSGYPYKLMTFGSPAFIAGVNDDDPLHMVLAPAGVPDAEAIRTAMSWHIAPDGKISSADTGIMTKRPDLVLLWENGGQGARLFNDNGLDVRFRRALTDKSEISLMTAYHHLDRGIFNHSNGSIWELYHDTYRNILNDPNDDYVNNYVSSEGINPQANDLSAVLRFSFHPTAGFSAQLKYSYDDRIHDVFRPSLDTAKKDSLDITTQTAYTHHAIIDVAINPPSAAFVALARFDVGSNVTHLNFPRSDTIWDNRSASTGFSGRLQPGFRFAECDSVLLDISAERDQMNRFTMLPDTFTLASGGIRSSLNHTLFGLLGTKLQVAGGLRSHDITYPAKREFTYYGKADLALDVAGFQIGGFCNYDRLGPTIPADTSFAVYKTGICPYLVAGADIGYDARYFGMNIALVKYHGISDSIVAAMWAPFAPPYKQPSQVLILSPRLGRWRGPVEIVSSVQFTDTKPRIKAQSDINFNICRKESTRSIQFDLGGTFWSTRDTGRTENIAPRNEPIYDISLKTSVQIKNFRLYNQIDNIMNRRIFYIPGQELPGLVFRWGFNWQILG